MVFQHCCKFLLLFNALPTKIIIIIRYVVTFRYTISLGDPRMGKTNEYKSEDDYNYVPV